MQLKKPFWKDKLSYVTLMLKSSQKAPYCIFNKMQIPVRTCGLWALALSPTSSLILSPLPKDPICTDLFFSSEIKGNKFSLTSRPHHKLLPFPGSLCLLGAIPTYHNLFRSYSASSCTENSVYTTVLFYSTPAFSCRGINTISNSMCSWITC
jgi:hypothetical protein